MASFCFIDRSTNKSSTLREVDEMICEREMIPVSPEMNCLAYQFLIDFGFTVLLTKGGFTIGEDHREFIETKCFSEFQDHSKALALWAFFEKWEFQAWR